MFLAELMGKERESSRVRCEQLLVLHLCSWMEVSLLFCPPRLMTTRPGIMCPLLSQENTTHNCCIYSYLSQGISPLFPKACRLSRAFSKNRGTAFHQPLPLLFSATHSTESLKSTETHTIYYFRETENSRERTPWSRGCKVGWRRYLTNIWESRRKACDGGDFFCWSLIVQKAWYMQGHVLPFDPWGMLPPLL